MVRAGLVVLLLLLASCGEEQPPAKTPAGAPSNATTKPWDVIHTFGYDLEAARASPRTPKGTTDEELLVRCVLVIRLRLRADERDEVEVWISGPDEFKVGTRGLDPAEVGAIPKVVAHRGTIDFLVEVRPDSEYQKAVLAGRDQPPRRHLWNGTDEQFEAWKQAEVRSWLESRRASKPYHPSRAGLRLVPAKEPPGDALEDFHVVEMPKEGAVVFDERMLRDPAVARDRLNRPVVVYRVANDMQNAFGLFTERNIGLPLALVVDGVWLAAPVIRDRLTSNVQITPGAGTPEEMQAEAMRMVDGLQSAGLPTAPVLREIEMP